MVEIFKALGDETRLRIVSLLLKDTLCVCEIEKVLKLTQSNASRHLTILKDSGILYSSKHAQWTYYRVNDRFKSDNNALWEYLQQKLKEIPTYQKDNAEYKKCKEQNLCNNYRIE